MALKIGQNSRLMVTQILQLATHSSQFVHADIYRIIQYFLASFRSENTRIAYLNDLKSFFEFSSEKLLLNIVNLEQVNERIIILWNNSLKNISNSSRARKLSSLSSFFEFAVKRKFIITNPVVFIQKPKVSLKSKTNILTEIEILNLLDIMREKVIEYKIENNSQYKIWKLRYAVIYTLLSVGMRVEELCTMCLNSLENVGQYWRLHLIAKGNEVHSPIIHENTAKILLEYKNEFRSHANENDPFFVRTQLSKKVTALSRSSVFDILNACIDLAGISKKISPHSCRASLATILHFQGVPLLHIQNLLNHKQITTTSIYVKNAEDSFNNINQKIDIFVK